MEACTGQTFPPIFLTGVLLDILLTLFHFFRILVCVFLCFMYTCVIGQLQGMINLFEKSCTYSKSLLFCSLPLISPSFSILDHSNLPSDALSFFTFTLSLSLYLALSNLLSFPLFVNFCFAIWEGARAPGGYANV